jgi:hypothetical protein
MTRWRALSQMMRERVRVYRVVQHWDEVRCGLKLDMNGWMDIWRNNALDAVI